MVHARVRFHFMFKKQLILQFINGGHYRLRIAKYDSYDELRTGDSVLKLMLLEICFIVNDCVLVPSLLIKISSVGIIFKVVDHFYCKPFFFC